MELTTQMLALLFDFPWEDRRKLTEWSDWMGDVELAQKVELKEQRRAVLEEAFVYFQRLWMEKANQPPTHDLLSMMLHSAAMSHLDKYEFIRSEEHTSALQSLMRISTAVFCLKKKQNTDIYIPKSINQLQTTYIY